MELLADASGERPFWDVFNGEIGKARVLLESSTLTAADLEPLRSQLVSLQTYATESTTILPPYDIRRSQEILEAIGKELRDAEMRLKPKKKFAFSSKNKPKGDQGSAIASSSSSSSSSSKAEEASQAPPASKDAEGGYTLRELLGGEVILLTEKELGVTSEGILPPLLLTHCTNATVSARCLLGAVRLENCTDCYACLGPCSTSVYLENCTRCTVFISSHQLRIHGCMGCSLYVRVNSHPIIEDCSQMGFAPYSLSYTDHDAHLAAAALQDARCWSNVVDFRWHRSTKSPNWYCIEEADRVRELPSALAPACWSVLGASQGQSAVTVPTTEVFAFASSSEPASGEEEEL
jgi:hypothetical protein